MTQFTPPAKVRLDAPFNDEAVLTTNQQKEDEAVSNTVSQSNNGTPLNVDAAVRDRYSSAAQAAEPQLCCAVDYDASYLKVIPQEIIERDYGCGDPSKHLQPGETVLDLGSGGGKICYIAAQVVGAEGRVIGVDCNDTMLDLAERYRGEVGDALGYHNVEFRKGRIQDLQLDLGLFDEYLRTEQVQSSSGWLHAEEHADHLRESAPLIEDDSVDVVVSNCVLNLVRMADRRQLFAEIFRVLKRGGRAIISDIVSDENVPEHLQHDPELWSGCLSGAFREDAFLEAFEEAGFYGIELIDRQSEPWQVIDGIEFRSVTVRAFKGKEGPCLDHKQAVIYNGPWKAVIDDDGHELIRGERTAVCDKTFRIYTQSPYGEHCTPVPPYEEISAADAQTFDCRANVVRSPQDTKNGKLTLPVVTDGDCCGTTGCC